jgi:LPXTG-motif cell wall-anchored protein
MRKNVKQQFALRVLSTAALMAMVSSIATAAFADTYDLTKGSVDILAEDGKQYITQWEDKDNDTCVKDGEGKEIRDREDSDITLTTKNETTDKTETTSNTVTIDAKEGNTANVTLQDVHIEVDTTDAKSGAIEIKGDGDTKLELNGDNTVLVENGWSEEHAAIEKADAYGTGTLTIKDDVNDNGTAKTGTDEDTTGKLLAGGYHGSAAIGGGRYSGDLDLRDTSNITITGGEITAIGGNDGCAGIGGGYNGTGKNIRIEGNAHVTAVAGDGAAIGGGIGSGNSVTITDDAVVDAYSAFAAAIGNGDNCGRSNDPTTITISGNATVHAENSQRGGCAIGNSRDGSLSDLTVNIEKNANVTAISSYDCPAIGTPLCIGATTTTINITGGTVNAINSFGSDNPEYSSQYDGTRDTNPAIGTTIDSDRSGTCNVNINSSTGDTVVNAYIYGKGSGTAVGSTIKTTSYNPYNVEYQYVPADSASYKADGSSHFGEINSAIVNCYNNGTVAKEKLNLPSTKDPLALNYNKYSHTITGGTLTKVVHNRKYMEEHPEEIVDITKLKDEDLHDWKLVGEVVEPTTEKDGHADYICSIDKCGQTKHVVLPKIVPDTPSTPETPDTPDTPNKPSTPDVPSTPEVTPADTAVAPDAVQADAAPADAAVTPAAAQNVVQDAKPEAAATAAVSAAALPQTGANWLAVVGSALSGLFLLAAGFVLDRKGRRMN